MGGKESRLCPLNYEDAIKRVKRKEYERLKDSFKRLGASSEFITKDLFINDVLGECVPYIISEQIYSIIGGNSKGISFRDLICGLVLITRGSQEERCKFIFNLYSSQEGSYIDKEEFLSVIIKCEESLSGNILRELFYTSNKIAYEEFRSWLHRYPDATCISRWLFAEPPCISLSNESEIATFYQTLAGVTHLSESTILELEKCFWNLKSTSHNGRLDINIFIQLICPPLSHEIIQGLFFAFDENKDGHIDFKEMVCGLSASCYGPLAERQKFLFKIFDRNQDGYLDWKEGNTMISMLCEIANRSTHKLNWQEEQKITSYLYESSDDLLPLDQYVIWAVNDKLANLFLELIFEVLHIVFRLQPKEKHDEANIVRNWMKREQDRGFHIGQVWYIISSSWWKAWNAYVDFQNETSNTESSGSSPSSLGGTLKRSAKLFCKEKEKDIVASNNGNIIMTAINILNSSYNVNQKDVHEKECRNVTANSSPISSIRLCRKISNSNSSSLFVTHPGAIKNSVLILPPLAKVTSLTGEGGQLRPELNALDYEIIPEMLWKALVSWYGGGVALPRQIIPKSDGEGVCLELYPVHIKFSKHQNNQNISENNMIGIVGGYGIAALSSSGYAYVPQNQYRPRRIVMYTCSFSQQTTIQKIFNFLCNKLHLKFDDTRLWLIKNENIMFLLDDDQMTLKKLNIKDGQEILIECRNKDHTWPEEIFAMSSHNRTHNLEKGVTGLNNLGNTCFLNAALQCVSSTQPLSLYFRSKCHLQELNPNNPHGMRGHIARRYGELVHELWSGASKTIAPLKLRWMITKYAPQFNGYQQHDSQELLAFLLDGLHEDLNRIQSKVYNELKDSDGRPDATVAQEAWDNHIHCNKSIIVDLFHGQLKSKVTCRECGHDSVRFDPFNYLSLQLPIENTISIEIVVIPMDGSLPIRYGLRMSSDETYSDLCQQLSEISSIASNNLLLAEITDSQIKNFPCCDHKISLQSSGVLFAYELYTPINFIQTELQNWRQSPTYNSSDSSYGSLQSESSSNPNYFFSSGVSLPDPKFLYFVAMHRKMISQEHYFLSHQKSRPALFGLPIIIYKPSIENGCQLYEAIWKQVSSLVTPSSVSINNSNHAQDCDNGLGYIYPFVLCAVRRDGLSCAWCPWYHFCRGCTFPCDSEKLCTSPCYLAIDWDPTALHLRYQEHPILEHCSTSQCHSHHSEPLELATCLDAFTKEENLTDEEKYYCSKCQKHQLATKKLQIWRLPPILIVHLKRFQLLNGRWVKSLKIVKFPFSNFDPTNYLASIPQQTILCHQLYVNDNYKYAETQSSLFVEEDSGIDFELEVSCSPNNLSSLPFILTGEHNMLNKQRSRGSTFTNCMLQDFHQHCLKPGYDPFKLRYHLYAITCHTGILGSGHYISYALHPNGKWYCYNDSSCKEVSIEQIDCNNAYILFYEREGLSYDNYLPVSNEVLEEANIHNSMKCEPKLPYSLN